MKKRITKSFTLLALCLGCFMCVLQANAQDTEKKKISFQGYSGGMMLHTGYLSAGKIKLPEVQVKTQGVPWGIGGILRFHFGKHLRIGGEGYSSNLHYGKNGSFLSLGWGGFLMDCQWKINKFTVFCGGTIGGGGVKNVTTVSPVSAHSTEINAIYRKYAVMLVAPFIGMEYTLTPKVSFIAKADCLVNLTQRQADFPIGVRIYAGIIFHHAKSSKGK
jgi:hypothetical protein